ncbi:hypothetical protein F4804DRAFT_330774 [Jackrogersella minutella]|nr:hypothetical protein F4804DRAFT_330774 [Jackrogersella minutella]
MSPLGSLLLPAIKKLLMKRLLPNGIRQPIPRKQIQTLTNPDPFTVLHDPSDDVDMPLCSIVAVHGLVSSIETAWTHKKSGMLWLQDFLHKDFDNKARIMGFCHHSSWKSQALVKDLFDHGKQFLGALEGRRATEKARRKQQHGNYHTNVFSQLIVERPVLDSNRPQFLAGY